MKHDEGEVESPEPLYRMLSHPHCGGFFVYDSYAFD